MRYARLSLRKKGLSDDHFMIAEVARELRQVFRSTYYAVALDIDGTLTPSGSLDVLADASHEISRVLDAGAYMLFFTGGGRATVQRVATKLLERSKNFSTRKNRLFAITGNGCQFHTVSSNGNLVTIKIVPTLKESLGNKSDDFHYQAQ
jgi:hydroxymethylpyrimidine pyrophosphatase-like HAD family hydrolase